MNESAEKGGKELTLLRKTLHRHPAVSGDESVTAQLVEAYLQGFDPDQLISEFGGHGLAAVFEGRKEGSTILVRSDLDALPIMETEDLPHHSRIEGVSHKCGHDGHMTIVAGLAPQFRSRPVERGRVVLLFQPSEETGRGAHAVITDPAFAQIRPDVAVALHNLPGFPLKSVILRDGVFASGSVGIEFHLHGATAHAAEPENGRSPALAMAQLIETIEALPQREAALHQAVKATVIHAQLGEIAFGTTPGEAVVMATLRAHEEEVLDRVRTACVDRAKGIAAAWGLQVEIRDRDPFPTTVNDSELVHRIETCAESLGQQVVHPEIPFAWSEDFGHFASVCPSILFGLGAGENHPPLHHPDYDFPDELLVPGRDLFETIVRDLSEHPR